MTSALAAASHTSSVLSGFAHIGDVLSTFHIALIKVFGNIPQTDNVAPVPEQGNFL